VFGQFFKFVCGLAGLIFLLSIVEYLPRPAHTQFWDRCYDTGHLFVFGLFVVLVLQIARVLFGTVRLRAQYTLAMVLSIGTGGIVEVWQQTHGRSAEWVDAYCDLIGVVAFAVIFTLFDSRIPLPRTGTFRRSCLFLIAGVLLAIGLVPLWFVCELYRVRRSILPQLIDFEQPWFQKFYYAQRANYFAMPPPEGWPESSTLSTVGRIQAHPGEYPGFVFMEPFPDWNGFRSLEIEVFYGDAVPRGFILRIHDARHNNDVADRFKKEVVLQPGFQTIKVALEDIRAGPQNRDLDLKRIRELALYTYQLDRKVTFYLGEIRLVK